MTAANTSGIDATGELEHRVGELYKRIDRIDRILIESARTLIREARNVPYSASGKPPQFPVWIARNEEFARDDNALTAGICLVTLQRLHHRRRRFPQLKDDFEGFDDVLKNLRKHYLVQRTGSTDADFDSYFTACFDLLDSKTFGRLNPHTAAQLFRVLMETGEDHAHTGIGCMAYFAMLWPLYRRSKVDPFNLGARIEPSPPSAYVTAKCVLPLLELRKVCSHRATLFVDLAQTFGELKLLLRSASSSPFDHAAFCSALGEFRAQLAAMAIVSIDAGAFRMAAQMVETELAKMHHKKDVASAYQVARTALRGALEKVSTRSRELLTDARAMLKRLNEQVISRLTREKVAILRDEMNFHFALEPSSPGFEVYLKELRSAAKEAHKQCKLILDQLDRVSTLVLAEPGAGDIDQSLAEAMELLADANASVAKLVQEPLNTQGRWCQMVVNREVAFASADNLTEFDPSELVSSIAVAVRTHRFSTELQVSDAMKMALKAVQRDDSWRLGQPYYSPDGIYSVRTPSSDIVWTLASALSRFPAITVADDALFRYVDWLERMQRRIERDVRSDHPATSTAASELVAGWPADRSRLNDRIHVSTTAYALNALLSIRDLAEHRLWELCTQRFTIVAPRLKLSRVDSVDLLAPHSRRISSVLSEMVRQTRTASKEAAYSLVLHGPPGSSKTTLAEALSREMWKGCRRWGEEEHRLIRITPADFTRAGESRVDSEAQFIFDLLGRIRGVTILFDEIDDLLRRREKYNESPKFLDLVIPAMLNRLQDLRNKCESQEICFLFGTNYVDRIEPALMRKGRIDRKLTVSFPDFISRWAIGEQHVREAIPEKERDSDEWKPRVSKVARYIAEKTAGWPWSGVTGVSKAAKRVVMSHMQQSPLLLDDSKLGNDLDAIVKEENTTIHLEEQYELRCEQDSAEVATEYLYYLISRCNTDDDERLGNHLASAIRSSGSLSARNRLYAAYDRLPHRKPEIDRTDGTVVVLLNQSRPEVSN